MGPTNVVLRRLALPACCLAGFAAWAAPAGAAERLYWTNSNGSTLSYANTDGSGGDDLAATGATLQGPQGLALDPARGRMYFSNLYSIDDGRISFANLDGSGAGEDLNTTGATLNDPEGLALDAAAGRVYWANRDTNEISFARLDNSGGDDLNLTGATVDGPFGLAIDPAARRLYWTNMTGNKISFANLDSGAGDDLNTAGATVNGPWGLALDPAAGRIYWSNSGNGTISFARLDGSGGDDLPTGSATVTNVRGVAVDPAGGRIYWGNNSNQMSFANLDGSGGADLPTPGATVSGPRFLALLERPTGTSPPVITGGTAPGSLLSCSDGAWAPDLNAASLYRAPAFFAYQWNHNGNLIPGTATNTHLAVARGDYRCQVTASNLVGGAVQMSAVHSVGRPPSFGARTLVTLALASGRIPARGPVPVRVRNANAFTVTGRLAGQSVDRVNVSARRRIRLRARAFRVPARARRIVRLALPKPLRRVLGRTGRLKLRLTATVRDPARNARRVAKRVTPRLKVARRR